MPRPEVPKNQKSFSGNMLPKIPFSIMTVHSKKERDSMLKSVGAFPAIKVDGPSVGELFGMRVFISKKVPPGEVWLSYCPIEEE